MNPEKATHSKEIRKILKEALHDNIRFESLFGIWKQACQANWWGASFDYPFIAKRQKKREKL